MSNEIEHKAEVTALRLQTLTAALDATLKAFGRATADIVEMAATERDLDDVKRIAPNAVVTSMSNLYERSGGSWSMFAVDARAQASRISAHIRDALRKPKSSAAALTAILTTGKEDAEHVYSPEVIRKYRQFMEGGLSLAKRASLIVKESEPDLFPETVPAPAAPEVPNVQRRRPRP